MYCNQNRRAHRSGTHAVNHAICLKHLGGNPKFVEHVMDDLVQRLKINCLI